MRRSYVLWQEHIAPLIVLEFVSGNGAEERDKTPWTRKFWIYEQVIHPAFYGIYELTLSALKGLRFCGQRRIRKNPNSNSRCGRQNPPTQ